MFTTRMQKPHLAETLRSVYEFPAGIFTGLRSTTQRIMRSLSQWSLSRTPKCREAQTNPDEVYSERAKAIELARFVVQRKNLGISLVPSQALMMSREFLLSVRENEIRSRFQDDYKD